MSSQFRQWREDVLAAAGILATVLDERYLGEEVLEDALIRDGEGALIADRVPWVRDYRLFSSEWGEAVASSAM